MSSCWGNYDKFRAQWEEGVGNLQRQPDEVVVIEGNGRGRWPQAEMMNEAVRETSSEWVWPLGIDNFAFPWALNHLDGMDADVVQFGYLRSDGAPYLVPAHPGSVYLKLSRNPFVSDSPFRRSAFDRAGGFPDIGFEDWGLWRRMIKTGARFTVSPFIHFLYRLHDESRSTLEYTEMESRREKYDEMLAGEVA